MGGVRCLRSASTRGDAQRIGGRIVRGLKPRDIAGLAEIIRIAYRATSEREEGRTLRSRPSRYRTSLSMIKTSGRPYGLGNADDAVIWWRRSAVGKPICFGRGGRA